MNIFALKGKGNSGKSTTIRLLHELFVQNDYQIINTTLDNQGGDFRTVFGKNGKLIGITSSGDTFDLVHDNLEVLINWGCVFCVCACRTSDRKPPGTNAAIDTFAATYKKQYVRKTIASKVEGQVQVNHRDALILFNLVDALV